MRLSENNLNNILTMCHVLAYVTHFFFGVHCISYSKSTELFVKNIEHFSIVWVRSHSIVSNNSVRV